MQRRHEQLGTTEESCHLVAEFDWVVVAVLALRSDTKAFRRMEEYVESLRRCRRDAYPTRRAEVKCRTERMTPAEAGAAIIG